LGSGFMAGSGAGEVAGAGGGAGVGEGDGAGAGDGDGAGVGAGAGDGSGAPPPHDAAARVTKTKLMPTIKDMTLVNIVIPFHSQGFKYFLSDFSLFVPDKQLPGETVC
jgi:hypothetical protein